MPDFEFEQAGPSQGDFDQMLAAKVAEPSDEDTPADDAETTEEPGGQLRGPDGRFVAQEGDEDEPEDTPVEDDDEPDTSEEDLDEDAQPEGDDPLAHARWLVGRQGQELGDVKKENQELRDRLARLEGRVEATVEQAQQPQTDTSTYSEDEIDSMVAEHGGQSVAVWALQNNRLDLYDMAIESWGVEEPVKAARFDARLQATLAAQNQPQAPAADPDVTAWRAAIEQQADLATPEMKQAVSDAMETAPKLVLRALAEGNVEQKTEAVLALREIALLKQGQDGVSKARQAVRDANRGAKVAATRTIAPGGGRNPDASGGQDAQREARVRAFKDDILSASNTDISAALGK